ncbi:hypothetical protein C8R44DRAFT_759544 [Mycena epipterygia]|nr:hypothetical protein C8R44DRAFT_759544 [Mycena epipterygia]
MSIAFTFADQNLLDSPLVGAEGTVHYSTSTTSGFRGRKLTTLMAASGLIGVIDWRKKIFVIDGVQRGWDTLKSRSGGIFSSEREWNWGSRPYHLKYHDSQKELLAKPNFGNAAGTVRFTTYRSHLFRDNEPAVIYFPHQMQDELERMFLLMAMLKTEVDRQDSARRARSNRGNIALQGNTGFQGTSSLQAAGAFGPSF